MTVLFYAHDNATLGPLAEALGRELAPEHAWYSAGVSATRVHPQVRRVLEEDGVSPLGLVARGVTAVPVEDVDVLVELDVGLPALPGSPRRLTWRLPEPSSAPVRDREEAFRAARDELRRRIRGLIA